MFSLKVTLNTEKPQGLESFFFSSSLTSSCPDVYLFNPCSVVKLCLTLLDPMDCSLPGSSDHGIFQAKVLEWVAISSSRGPSQPRDRILYHWATWEAYLTANAVIKFHLWIWPQFQIIDCSSNLPESRKTFSWKQQSLLKRQRVLWYGQQFYFQWPLSPCLFLPRWTLGDLTSFQK